MTKLYHNNIWRLNQRFPSGVLVYEVHRGQSEPASEDVLGAMNRLRETLTADEFSISGVQIDRVQAAIESFKSLSSYRTALEREIERDIDCAFSSIRPQQTHKPYFIWSFGNVVDHWRNRS